jgi:hypothetical protein
MNKDWKSIGTPIPETALPTNYALTADPGKPLREANQEIERLNKQITIMRSDYLAQMNTVITERDVYRNLVLKIMKIKD